jgi:hypothetical protein
MSHVAQRRHKCGPLWPLYTPLRREHAPLTLGLLWQPLKRIIYLSLTIMARCVNMQMTLQRLARLCAMTSLLHTYWQVSTRNTTLCSHPLLAALTQSLLAIYMHSCSVSSSIESSRPAIDQWYPVCHGCLPWWPKLFRWTRLWCAFTWL